MFEAKHNLFFRNLLSMPHAHLNVSNTPSTFAGDAGAGESLSQQHDISQARLLPLMVRNFG